MSRSRNIKPGFFKNEDLAECDPLARILFAGLWCQADREGRMEDRPKRLKAELLPYDDCDIETLLNQLERFGFIVRYERNGNKYLAVPEFKKHQNPHMREPASQIPAPCEHSASTVLASCEHSSGPADSPFLIPDSIEKPSSETADAVPDPATSKEAKRQERLAQVTAAAIDAYNATMSTKGCGLLPYVRPTVGTTKRQQMVRRCIDTAREICRTEFGSDRITAEFWAAYFGICAEDPFCSGKQQPGNGHENWRPDFEYLTRPAVMLRLYDRSAA